MGDALDNAVLFGMGGSLRARDPAMAAFEGSAPRPLRGLLGELTGLRARGVRRVLLVGGEITLRKDLGRLLGLVREAGLQPGLVSDGWALSQELFRRGLLDSGVRYLRVGLHGSDAGTHDGLVGRAGAFELLAAGLPALLAEAPEVFHLDVACSLARSNLDALPALAALVAGWTGLGTVTLRLVAPVNDGEARPAQADAAAAVAGLLDAPPDGLDVVWEGLAPCLLPNHAERRDERLRYGLPAYGETLAGALPREESRDRSHPYPCQECVHEHRCPGAPRLLLEHEGEAALRPSRGVRANSYNYELDRSFDSFDIRPGACTAMTLGLELPPERYVFLQRDEDVALFTTPTHDFTADELRWIRDDLEQVYIDVAESATLHDFYTGVRRTRTHEACKACPDRVRCGGALVVDPELPFLPEERWLQHEVARARGRMLDVGCGEQPYREVLASAIAVGHLEYHGLDPDAAALERFRAAGVGGTLHVGTIEDFPTEHGPFDVVVAFRSPNHFRDMAAAFARMTELLRPGGLLYLCDSIAFGMLRTPRQVAYADENAPVGHEHFRNWSSEQIVSLLERFPVRIVEHHPVRPDGSNQWLVKAERLPDARSPG